MSFARGTRVRVRELALLFFLTSCGAGPGKHAAREPARRAPVVSDYLPFEDQTTLSFLTRDDLGGTSFFVMEIERPSETRGEIWIAGRRTRYDITPNRVARVEGGLLLEAPLKIGHTFPGPFGAVRIMSTSERVTVPAGTFENCLVTLEETTEPPKRVETTFCPQIGVVRVVVDGASDTDVTRVQSELTAYGPRIDIRRPAARAAETNP